MINVLLHGACGRMGHMIYETAEKYDDIRIVAGVDAYGEAYAAFPVYKSLDEVTETADVCIDFSNAAAVDGLLEYCAAKALPVAVCTTGLSEAQMAHLKEVSSKVAVLKSANMSVGINLLLNVLREVSPKLAAAGFDIEILEKHHNQKLDAPSGTAVALADAVNESLDNEYEIVFDRSSRREKRPVKEIGVSAMRGGTIPGTHDVMYAGQDEIIQFSHIAYSRAIFAQGAITAAQFLAGKPAGLYSMQDALA